jgi:thiol:disulfide interchange protein
MTLVATSVHGVLGRVTLLLALVPIAGGAARAQENPVTWSLRVPPAAAKVRAGGLVRAELTARMEPGWHLYSMAQPPPPIATRIGLAKGQPFTIDGTIEAPMPASGFDENFEINVEYYADEATFILPVRAAASTPPGPQTIVAEAFFQTCNDRFCMPPKAVKAEAIVEVLAAAAASVPAPSPLTGAGAPSSPVGGGESAPAKPAVSTPTPPSPDLQAAAIRQQPFGSFLWLAVSMGVLALLTPCVFPMVPITVSYFTNHAAGRRGAAVRRALIYSAGIILTFTALGMLIALVLGATSLNQFAANPWINILITSIFVAFALNLFGAFELALPSSVVTRLDHLTRREGGSEVLGTLLMGFTFTLTSFTCTVPFVGTLLVMAAGGEWQWPLVGMLAFSTAFASPFFVLALAPQWLSQLPRSGGWMNSVKVVMGFLEVAAAMKFISNVDLVWGWGIFTREVVLATWVGVGVVMTAYILGMFRLSHDTEVERVGAGRLVTALICLTVTVWLLTGLFGRRLGELDAFLPPATEASAGGSVTGSISGELPWIMNDYQGALAQAAREGKRVLIDFTGYTCTNCRWMEANMFPRPDVRRELEHYVRVRLYTDGDGDLYRRQQQFQQTTFHTIALPFYAILAADGTPLTTFPGLTRDPAEFVAFLRGGRNSGP